MSKKLIGKKATRRDFLVGVGAGALMAGFPWRPRAAIAATGAEKAPENAEIAHVRIYPAIGICRVGGSQEWFLAPEVPGLPPRPHGGFKDGTMLIKKQVQRFRVYAFDAENRVIGELANDRADVVWSVHLANTKGAWYGFNNPLDNGELAPGLPGQLRNQYFVSDQQREEMLLIDGGRKEIAGAFVNHDGHDAHFAFKGTFWGTEEVGLGQLRTDEAGRLLVVPPDGVSNSPTNAGITSFADNDGWHDDWCDGPVTATVRLPDGRIMEAEPSWVACVGPNFAPEIPPISTLHDVIQNMNIEQGWEDAPSYPLSFRNQIYPTFHRVALMDWLTDAAHLRHGWMNIGDFSNPDFIRRLADNSPGNEAFRRSVLEHFRDPDPTKFNDESYKEQRLKIPYMMGDGVNYDGSPLQWFQFPMAQYQRLVAWANGDFVDDWHHHDQEIERLEDIPVELQPAALTEAALEPCSGGAFHPGVELTYYLRMPAMFARHYDEQAEPYRIAHGHRPSLLQNIGRLLTLEQAVNGGNGAPPPIGPQSAGDLTRWMGLPWQCDAFSCQQVLLQENYPTAVWWPALLPINVLPEAYYDQLDEDLPVTERVKYLNSRVAWSRDVAGIGYHANGSYWDGITNMITLWQRMGFVVKRPLPHDLMEFNNQSDTAFVEVGRADTMEFRFNWKPSDGMLPK